MFKTTWGCSSQKPPSGPCGSPHQRYWQISPTQGCLSIQTMHLAMSVCFKIQKFPNSDMIHSCSVTGHWWSNCLVKSVWQVTSTDWTYLVHCTVLYCIPCLLVCVLGCVCPTQTSLEEGGLTSKRGMTSPVLPPSSLKWQPCTPYVTKVVLMAMCLLH